MLLMMSILWPPMQQSEHTCLYMAGHARLVNRLGKIYFKFGEIASHFLSKNDLLQ